jgi:hypothetical protein
MCYHRRRKSIYLIGFAALTVRAISVGLQSLGVRHLGVVSYVANLFHRGVGNVLF